MTLPGSVNREIEVHFPIWFFRIHFQNEEYHNLIVIEMVRYILKIYSFWCAGQNWPLLHSKTEW